MVVRILIACLGHRDRGLRVQQLDRRKLDQTGEATPKEAGSPSLLRYNIEVYSARAPQDVHEQLQARLVVDIPAQNQPLRDSTTCALKLTMWKHILANGAVLRTTRGKAMLPTLPQKGAAFFPSKMPVPPSGPSKQHNSVPRLRFIPATVVYGSKRLVPSGANPLFSPTSANRNLSNLYRNPRMGANGSYIASIFSLILCIFLFKSTGIRCPKAHRKPDEAIDHVSCSLATATGTISQCLPVSAYPPLPSSPAPAAETESRAIKLSERHFHSKVLSGAEVLVPDLLSILAHFLVFYLCSSFISFSFLNSFIVSDLTETASAFLPLLWFSRWYSKAGIRPSYGGRRASGAILLSSNRTPAFSS
ncbi:hypothetical protein RJ641_011920 [Dillenia turbinata]|uniref:Uncharacterized protein n=1 Tax=Dillenia turbinata TaxID=194707 RepID=A0AAN8V4V5_9MAGN